MRHRRTDTGTSRRFIQCIDVQQRTNRFNADNPPTQLTQFCKSKRLFVVGRDCTLVYFGPFRRGARSADHFKQTSDSTGIIGMRADRQSAFPRHTQRWTLEGRYHRRENVRMCPSQAWNSNLPVGHRDVTALHAMNPSLVCMSWLYC